MSSRRHGSRPPPTGAPHSRRWARSRSRAARGPAPPATSPWPSPKAGLSNLANLLLIPKGDFKGELQAVRDALGFTQHVTDTDVSAPRSAPLTNLPAAAKSKAYSTGTDSPSQSDAEEDTQPLPSQFNLFSSQGSQPLLYEQPQTPPQTSPQAPLRPVEAEAPAEEPLVPGTIAVEFADTKDTGDADDLNLRELDVLSDDEGGADHKSHSA